MHDLLLIAGTIVAVIGVVMVTVIVLAIRLVWRELNSTLDKFH